MHLPGESRENAWVLYMLQSASAIVTVCVPYDRTRLACPICLSDFGRPFSSMRFEKYETFSHRLQILKFSHPPVSHPCCFARSLPASPATVL